MVSEARGATAYIARRTAKGYGLSAPCDACTEALIEAGIKRAVFTTEDGYGSIQY